MSLGQPSHGARRFGFPRVSGDEPLYTGDLLLSEAFSPRERG